MEKHLQNEIKSISMPYPAEVVVSYAIIMDACFPEYWNKNVIYYKIY